MDSEPKAEREHLLCYCVTQTGYFGMGCVVTVSFKNFYFTYNCGGI